MGELAKMLILLGAVLVVLGLIVLLLQKTPFLGKLPGDILIKREHVTIYFPLATSNSTVALPTSWSREACKRGTEHV
jgi:hypothetical protein